MPYGKSESRRCWFEFEGENKGEDIESESDEQAARIYYGTWVDEVDEGTRIFVRSSVCVTQWSVSEERRYVAVQLNAKEGA